MNSPTRKKKMYLLLGKKSNFLYGVFPRSKEGRAAAVEYKNSLKDKKDSEFIIK